MNDFYDDLEQNFLDDDDIIYNCRSKKLLDSQGEFQVIHIPIFNNYD